MWKEQKRLRLHNKVLLHSFNKPDGSKKNSIFYSLLVIMHNFTPEDLLLYLYKETDSETTAAIEAALEKDWTLREKLSVLKTSMDRLDSIKTSPRTEVILNILKYAKGQEKLVPSSN